MEERRSLEDSLKNFAFRVLTAILTEDVRSLLHVVLAESDRFPEIGKPYGKSDRNAPNWSWPNT
jgi:hypothetical protein